MGVKYMAILHKLNYSQSDTKVLFIYTSCHTYSSSTHPLFDSQMKGAGLVLNTISDGQIPYWLSAAMAYIVVLLCF